MKIALALCAVAAAGLWPAVGLAADDSQPGVQQKAALTKTIEVKTNYLIYLPKDYAQKEAWPLLLFLHGAGERGDDLDVVKKHGPPKLVEEGQDLPFIVVSPQCPRDRWWQPFELLALLDDVASRLKVDDSRIYVTGLSMGGFGTWALASTAPERFAAIIPICGGGDTRAARRLGSMPVWVFHGAKDSAVALSESEKMVEALKERGGNVKFTVYPEAGHDSWTETYSNPAVFEWLLQQQRAPAGGERPARER